MIKRGLNKGFTVVELLVVIICVAILATLIALSYGKVQTQGSDTKIRDAADKFAEAIKLMHLRQNSFPKGGRVSSGVASATTGCASGANGFQAPAYSGIACTIGDAAVAMGYLPASLFADLPPNAEYGNTSKDLFVVFACGTKSYLFYWLEAPSAAETADYNSAYATCSAAFQTDLTNYKMKAAIDLSDF